LLLGLSWPFAASALLVSMAVGVMNVFFRRNQQQDAELRLSHDEVRRLAATAERERIGRDLHDLLGHTLSLITLKLELSRKLFDRDSEAARREVIEAEKVARHALAEVRAAVTGIRATDLAAELASARLLLESSGVAIDYGAPPALPVEVERDLALVLREAATNIARHAGATHANVAFEVIDGGLCVTVADNGRGGIDAEGNGLTGMRERVRALGGRLQIHSQRGQGTRLRVVVPQPDRRQPPLPATEPAITVLPMEPRAS
jgi:two-component system sensor histidine kinase DesK